MREYSCDVEAARALHIHEEAIGRLHQPLELVLALKLISSGVEKINRHIIRLLVVWLVVNDLSEKGRGGDGVSFRTSCFPALARVLRSMFGRWGPSSRMKMPPKGMIGSSLTKNAIL